MKPRCAIAPPEAPARPGAPGASPGFAWPPDKRLVALAGAAAGLLLLLVVAAWLLARRKRRKAPRVATALPAGAEGEAAELAEGPAEQSLPAPPTREQIESEVLRALKMPAAHTQKAEILIRELRSQISKDPPGATQVLRMWLRGV